MLRAVVEAVAEVLHDAPGEVVACGLDHQGESVIAWDGTTGRPLTNVITWQDKRSQSVLDRLEGQADTITARSGLPLDPYFSAGKLAWLLENDERVRSARASGALRMGTVDAFLCDRLGAGFSTDPATASRTQLYVAGDDEWDDQLCRCFGVPRDVLPAIRDSAGALGRAAPRAVAGGAAAARDDRRPAGRAGRRRVRGARAREGDLRHRRVRARPRRRPRAARRGRAAADGGVADRRDDRVRARRRRVRGGRDARVDVRGARASPTSPAELSALARSVEHAAGARVLPALAGLGAPWWQPDARAVLAGLHGGVSRAHVARAALEGIAWRVADIVEVVRDTVGVEELRVDGGLTNEPLMLQLQADAIGAPVVAGGADATALGAALLAGVGAGVFGSPVRGRAAAGLRPPRRAARRRGPPRRRARRLARVRALSGERPLRPSRSSSGAPRRPATGRCAGGCGARSSGRRSCGRRPWRSGRPSRA